MANDIGVLCEVARVVGRAEVGVVKYIKVVDAMSA